MRSCVHERLAFVSLAAAASPHWRGGGSARLLRPCAGSFCAGLMVSMTAVNLGICNINARLSKVSRGFSRRYCDALGGLDYHCRRHAAANFTPTAVLYGHARRKCPEISKRPLEGITSGGFLVATTISIYPDVTAQIYQWFRQPTTFSASPAFNHPSTRTRGTP